MGRKRQGQRDSEGPTEGKPPRGQHVPQCRPRAEKGGINWHGNKSRCRHAARGTGTSGREWRASGTGDNQGGGNLHRERMWGAGENCEGFKEERVRMGRR